MNPPVENERAERTAEGDFLLQIDLTVAVQLLLVLHEVRVEWLTGRTDGRSVTTSDGLYICQASDFISEPNLGGRHGRRQTRSKWQLCRSLSVGAEFRRDGVIINSSILRDPAVEVEPDRKLRHGQPE